ncbi:MAG: GGDEF domain-containing protein, partial [Kofleriaceae bacterium]
MDSDQAQLLTFQRILGTRYRVVLATSDIEALTLIQALPEVACVLADTQTAGATLFARVAAARPHCRRAVIAGAPHSADLIGEINAGHVHYVIAKPWTNHDLAQVVDQLTTAFRLEIDNRRLLAQLHEHQQVLQEQLIARGHEITAATERLAQMGHQLDRMALRDGLTGLYSHLAFQERLRDAVSRATRFAEPLSLLLADIDGFANINYEIGYQTGDDILRRIATLLQSETPDRSTEVVARFSGEEFAILLPDTSKSAALTRAARLRDAISIAQMPGGRQLTMSFGVASLPDDAADPEGLLTAAEAAVRGAKRGGPGRVQFFAASDNGRTRGSVTRTFGRPPDVDRFRHYQERMNEVTAILARDRSLSCLLVD